MTSLVVQNRHRSDGASHAESRMDRAYFDIYVNGALADREEIQRQADSLARMNGVKPHLVYNRSQGPIDYLNTAVSIASPELGSIVEGGACTELNQLLDKGLRTGVPIRIYCHSQGANIVRDVLIARVKQDPQLAERVSVFTTGSTLCGFPAGVKVTQYAFQQDPAAVAMNIASSATIPRQLSFAEIRCNGNVVTLPGTGHNFRDNYAEQMPLYFLASANSPQDLAYKLAQSIKSNDKSDDFHKQVMEQGFRRYGINFIEALKGCAFSSSEGKLQIGSFVLPELSELRPYALASEHQPKTWFEMAKIKSAQSIDRSVTALENGASRLGGALRRFFS